MVRTPGRPFPGMQVQFLSALIFIYNFGLPISSILYLTTALQSINDAEIDKK